MIAYPIDFLLKNCLVFILIFNTIYYVLNVKLNYHIILVIFNPKIETA